MNGTTASADLPGMHHARWGPAPEGAPRRIYAERADVYGDIRTASRSSVLPAVAAELFHPGMKMVTQATG